MMLKYAIALAIVLILAAFFAWAFLPARHLPGNRARHLRIRLHLRLHPGKGFAHLFSLWLLRLSLAPISTLAGFRAWVLAECPAAPSRRAPRPPLTPAGTPRVAPTPRLAGVPRPTKTARFLTLVTERHGPLAAVPLHAVAGIAAALAPQVDLNPGAARTALRHAILTAHNGDPR